MRNVMRDIMKDPIFNDIYIRHQVDETDQFIDRVLLIHSDKYENGKKDGALDVLSSMEGFYNHWVYWFKYLESNYLDDVFLQQSFAKRDKAYFEFVTHCLNIYDDIIFLDWTDLEESSKYSDGYLLIPEFITERQYQRLQLLVPYLKKFKSIIVEGGKYVDDTEEFFSYLEEFPISYEVQKGNFSLFLVEILQSYKRVDEIHK